jgi:lincosamide nucleotidyltransferase
MSDRPDTAGATRVLLQRLEAIGLSLQRSGGALALLGLGSVGQELHRLDRWSDLDFFAVVEPGQKGRFIQSLDWLASAHPLVWHFQNTADGHKALMADGVFCEFAVFEPEELCGIPYAPGRVVWCQPRFDQALAHPAKPLPGPASRDETWIVGEALSCLLVGLQRWHRGERLSAARFVQGYAVDRLIELDALRCTPPAGDPFAAERRLEARQPGLANELPSLVPGYTQTCQAALALLGALRARGAQLNAAMVARIESLARP